MWREPPVRTNGATPVCLLSYFAIAGSSPYTSLIERSLAGQKEALARLLESQNISPVILSEQANQGRTIIEKFELYSDVGAAIILFTSDDLGCIKGKEALVPRARQNVIFEAGYFMGKLGRDRVVAIAEDKVEIPSDLQGVVYTGKNDWKLEVCRELKAMGYFIDFNKLF